jgi:hypothetical protein
MQDRYRIRLGSKSLNRIKEKIKELTKRSQSISMSQRLIKLNQVTEGWVNYFAIADCKKALQMLDEMIRTRLRMCIWKSWKKVGNRMKQLIELGMEEWKAHRNANTRKSYCRTAHSGILCHTLTNGYFRKIGYKEMSTTYLKRQV